MKNSFRQVRRIGRNIVTFARDSRGKVVPIAEFGEAPLDHNDPTYQKALGNATERLSERGFKPTKYFQLNLF